jgi:hypothetical protein
MPRVTETKQDRLAAYDNMNMYITDAFNNDISTEDIPVKST